jgi:sodium/bile acid cotransporter 7
MPGTHRMNPLRSLKRLGFDSFVISLIVVVFLAYMVPQGGSGTGPFSLSQLGNYGVSVIFFFYGMKLSIQKLRLGLNNWKLHILIQCSTFILFPLVMFRLGVVVISGELERLWLGSFFLASLPSTVSSSVVMVSIAEGNIPAAIFNASLSSVLGVFITPLWMGLASIQGAGSLELENVFMKLIIQVLLPLILGMLLNKPLGYWAEAKKQQLKYFDQSIILIIVYTSFSASFENKMFATISIAEIILFMFMMMALFFLVFFIIRWICQRMHFTNEDTITAVFCGSKKSLVHGTVMARVLFANSTITGVLLLPLMVYHALQLIAASILANGMIKRGDKSVNGNRWRR